MSLYRTNSSIALYLCIHVSAVYIQVLDGIPMRSGKVSLSALSHTGPVKFISSIQCSLTFAMQPLNDDSGLYWD